MNSVNSGRTNGDTSLNFCAGVFSTLEGVHVNT